MIGRASPPRSAEFALYGDTTGETDELGLPVRLRSGRPAIAAARPDRLRPHPALQRRNRSTTPSQHRHRLRLRRPFTALRWPERELVSLRRSALYASPPGRLRAATPPGSPTRPGGHDDLLDLRTSRQAVDRDPPARARDHPRGERGGGAGGDEPLRRRPPWLIYLPPTMSPSETSHAAGLLEHPAEAFAYYRRQGVGRVVCEEKHMGSRAVVVVCRDADAAARALRRRRTRRARHRLHPHRAALLRDAELKRALLARFARPSRAAGCGRSSRPTGCASTAS